MARANLRKTYGAIAVGVVAIGWSAIFVRWAQMPGIASAFYRMFIASVVLWPLALLSGVRVRGMSRRAYVLAGLSGVFFAGDIGMFNTAVLHTSAGSATFLSNNAPLLVGLLTWAVTRRLPAGRFWIALVIASAGAWMIVSVDANHAESELGADLLAVGASACFALYLITTEWVRKDMDTRLLVAISATSSAVVLLIAGVVANVPLAVPSTKALGAVVGLGLVCQITGYFCLTHALGHLPATVTSVMLLAVAPVTAMLALEFFNERMTWLQLVGGVLVLFGMWIVSRGPKVALRENAV